MADERLSRPYLGTADPPPPPPSRPDPPRPEEVAEAEPLFDASRLVRPYMLTGGRTRSERADLPIEAMVALTREGQDASQELTFENHRIAEMCRKPISIAEISAHMKVPIGVARVLVADMVGGGLLKTFKTRTKTGNHAGDSDLVRRLIDGVRAL